MRVLVLSDVHGNLPALEYVLNQEKNADLVISLGDVVNYGPWSNECVILLDSLKNKVLLKGNHEEAFISGQYPGTNEVAKAFFNFCYPSFICKTEINKYSEQYTYKEFDFVHTLNNTYIFPDTELQLHRNTFIGHSHRQFVRTIDNHILVNVGSAGQNRVNIDELNYALWDSESGKTQLVQKFFSADSLLDEMKSKNYPEICLQYIQSKRKL